MLDAIHTWDRPITVNIGREQLVVRTPIQARHVLLMDWPAERTDKHKIASELCLAATEGASPETAWVAFMDAALEAGIFVE
jgi:hypothetical protein